MEHDRRYQEDEDSELNSPGHVAIVRRFDLCQFDLVNALVSSTTCIS